MRRQYELSGTPEHQAWRMMIQRCYNSNHPQYFRYGGRGIIVCEEWKNDFTKFYDHIGPKPGPGYSLDRIDNNGNYEPGNVRWATAKEQANNRRFRQNRDRWDASIYGTGISAKGSRFRVYSSRINGKSKYIGTFDTPEEAQIARQEWIKKNQQKEVVLS